MRAGAVLFICMKGIIDWTRFFSFAFALVRARKGGGAGVEALGTLWSRFFGLVSH